MAAKKARRAPLDFLQRRIFDLLLQDDPSAESLSEQTTASPGGKYGV